MAVTPPDPSGGASAAVRVERPGDLDGDAVLAVAAGADVTLGGPLLDAVARRRRAVLDLLRDGPAVYGVTTGMGALSGTRLTETEQADHSRRLMLARAVGGPPWLDEPEVRAAVAVRLRGFLERDAGVSDGLCRWLASLLEARLVPEVPRTGSGAAGEILPLAHAWGHLAGVGPLADRAIALGAPALGLKEGVALLSGVPVATALGLLRSAEGAAWLGRAETVAAATAVAVGAPRDPWHPALARGDEVHAAVLRRLRDLAGEPPAPPRHLQAPVSLRVAGPVLAAVARAVAALREAAERSLGAVTDSPAFVEDGAGARFVGTAGFHGLELALACDAASAALGHASAVGAARLHRLLDPAVTGLPAQLSADPGPQAGLAPVHKRAAAVVHDLASRTSPALAVETSTGQEDVQTFALASAERLRHALDGARQVLACELLAVHQAHGLDPHRWSAASPALLRRLDVVADLLPAGTDDRPWGPDLETLRTLLAAPTW